MHLKINYMNIVCSVGASCITDIQNVQTNMSELQFAGVIVIRLKVKTFNSRIFI